MMNDLELEQAVQNQKDRLTKIIHETGEMIASINFLEELYAQANTGILTLDSLEHACHVFADSGQGYQPWIDQINHFCQEAKTWPKPTDYADLAPESPYLKKLGGLLESLAAQIGEQ